MLAAGTLSASAYAETRRGIWEAFARFGMGPNAQSNGASLSGIVTDFHPPPFEEPEPPEPEVRIETTPNLAIPDNQPTGISSVLTVPQAGRMARLTVAVDIQHPFIGDLRVSVTTPAGGSVVLHQRSGGRTQNLVKSYSSEELPALAGLLGQQAQGNWTLHVADLAGLDVGTLRRWRLEMDLAGTAQSVVHGEVAPGLTIPDNDRTGVRSIIHVAQAGTTQRVQVSVDITHTFIGDLRVELVAPTSQQALLHDQFGGAEDNLITTYDSLSHPALAALVGQSMQGNWELRVSDVVGQDIGKLNRWRLELTL
jgi:subtilisin-like proprotein convertase family protein